MFVTRLTRLQLVIHSILLNILTMFADKTDIQTEMSFLMVFGKTNKLYYLTILKTLLNLLNKSKKYIPGR